jgi:tetratricopeptide (TPR) repeat protein
MFECKYPKKIISLFVIVAFIFNIQSILLHSEELDDWDKQFNSSKEAYKEGEYTKLKEKIEWIINHIPGRKDLLGKCHLLLGAVYEKQGNEDLAKINYRKAKDEYDIESIEGIDLENLEIYRRIIKGEDTGDSTDRVIEKPQEKKKKKFPVLLVVGGVAVVAVAAIHTSNRDQYL